MLTKQLAPPATYPTSPHTAQLQPAVSIPQLMRHQGMQRRKWNIALWCSVPPPPSLHRSPSCSKQLWGHPPSALRTAIHARIASGTGLSHIDHHIPCTVLPLDLPYSLLICRIVPHACAQHLDTCCSCCCLSLLPPSSSPVAPHHTRATTPHMGYLLHRACTTQHAQQHTSHGPARPLRFRTPHALPPAMPGPYQAV